MARRNECGAWRTRVVRRIVSVIVTPSCCRYPSGFSPEGCPAGQPLRMGTAKAVVRTTLLRIQKRLGLIEYNGGLKVNSSLLSIVLHD